VDINLSQCVSVIGIYFDIVGAYYLAQGFINKKPKYLLNETAITHGNLNNIYSLRSFLEQKAEAIIGFILLAFGFSLQMIAVIFASEYSLTTPTLMAITISILILIHSIPKALIACLARKYKLNFAMFIFNLSEKTAFTNDDGTVDIFIKQLVGIKRKEGEGVDDYINRAKKCIKKYS